MKNTAILTVMLVLISGCSSLRSTHDYSSSFTAFQQGNDKEAYCQKVTPAGKDANECLHQLIVHERAGKYCASANSAKDCMTLNRNLWEYQALSAHNQARTFASVLNTKPDFAVVHLSLVEKANKYVVQCPTSRREYAPCKGQ